MEKTGRAGRRSIWILAGSLVVLGLLWVLLYPGTEMTGERVRTIRMPRTSLKEIKKEKLRQELGLVDESLPEKVSDQEGAVGAEAPGGAAGETRRLLPKEGAVEVIVQALEKTRVHVILDGEPEYEKALEPGDRHACRAGQRVKLQIENGSGVRIFYGGQVYENLGKKGDVVNISFPPAGAE
jgi:hypothetical protein